MYSISVGKAFHILFFSFLILYSPSIMVAMCNLETFGMTHFGSWVIPSWSTTILSLTWVVIMLALPRLCKMASMDCDSAI